MIDEKYLLSESIKNELKDPKRFGERVRSCPTFQEALGFSNDAVLDFYNVAKNLLEQKRYAEAADAFFFLTQLAPQVKAFWLGMARSERLNNRLDQAIPLYIATIAFDESDQEAYLECVRCCLEAGQNEQAIYVLDIALNYVGRNEDVPGVRELYRTCIECKEWILAQANRG